LALISPDGVAPSQMVGVYASLILPCTIKFRGIFLLQPAYPDSPGKGAIKPLCVRVCVLVFTLLYFAMVNYKGYRTSKLKI